VFDPRQGMDCRRVSWADPGFWQLRALQNLAAGGLAKSCEVLKYAMEISE